MDLFADLLLATVLAATGPVEMVYIVCLIVGGGLLVISTVFGGHSGDVDTDVDLGLDAHVDSAGALDGHADFSADAHADLSTDAHADMTADAHAHHDVPGALALAKWFSIRFLVYFAAVFGFVGTALTYLTTMRPAVTLAIAVAVGLVVGQAVHQLMRYLGRSGGNSAASRNEYLHKTARVTVGIQPARVGEVSLIVGGHTRFIPAVARRKDAQFTSGDPVVIWTLRDGTAEVVSREEYEFLTDSRPA